MRVPIPDHIAADVLYASNHTCCVCQIAGKFVQVHHIDEDHANSKDIENLAVLCVECHISTQLTGGFVRHLWPPEVRRFRDGWLVRVEQRRDLADRLAAEALAGLPKDVTASDSLTVSTAESVAISDGTSGAIGVGEAVLSIQGHAPEAVLGPGPATFVKSLIQLRRLAHLEAKQGWDSGTTGDMLNATYSVINTMQAAMTTLATYLPGGRLDGQDAKGYFSELIASRFCWRRLTQHLSGTMAEVVTGGEVLSDAEMMVVQMVRSLVLQEVVTLDFESWRTDWNSALE